MTATEFLVVDASVVVAWGLGEEVHAEKAGLLQMFFLAGGRVVVPQIFPVEVVGAFVVAERDGRTTATETDTFLQNLGRLPVELDETTSERVFREVLTLARKHKLKAQDACYLELCFRRSLRLATVDEALSRAARAIGIAYP